MPKKTNKIEPRLIDVEYEIVEELPQTKKFQIALLPKAFLENIEQLKQGEINAIKVNGAYQTWRTRAKELGVSAVQRSNVTYLVVKEN